MVPSLFITLAQLPLTPNGKVDRNALPEPDQARPTLTAQYMAPKNDIETTIATIWADVLNVDKVGVHDNFFDLGGHSLRMVRVHSKLKAHFDHDLPMVKLFEHPTIAAMAQFFTESQSKNGASTKQALPQFDQAQNRANRQKMARDKQRKNRAARRNQ